MLILSRRVDQRILIGDNIAITVTKILGGDIKIGIDAPRETKILRAELQGRLRGAK